MRRHASEPELKSESPKKSKQPNQPPSSIYLTFPKLKATLGLDLASASKYAGSEVIETQVSTDNHTASLHQNTEAYLWFGDISTVALIVGKKKTAFHVHVDLLCENSSFFRAAFRSPWKENTEREIRLADDDAVSFELFVQWLYTRHYEITTEKEPGVARLLEPIRLYVLAEKYDVVELKNKICQEIYAGCTAHGFGPTRKTVEYAYDNLPQTSPMRRMLVDWHAWHVTCKWFEEEGNQEWLPRVPGFAADLAVALGKRSRNPRAQSPLELGVAGYYEEKDIEGASRDRVRQLGRAL